MYEMTNYDHSVIYEGIASALRHAEKISTIRGTDSGKEAIEELIHMAEGLLYELTKIEVKEDE